MAPRRLQDDDARGVQEPLNETMCGCNDVGAAIGRMGAHGHEGDGGCVCAGLTVRGRHWILFDTVESVHAARRTLSESINFPPLLAFSAAALPAAHRKPISALSQAMPPNVKLVTLTSNYAAHNDGKLLLRLSHLYAAGEHATLSQPATVDLSAVFAAAGLVITAASETTLTANQPLSEWEKRKHQWRTHSATAQAAHALKTIEASSFETRVPFDYPHVTIRPMEVRTFLATFQ